MYGNQPHFPCTPNRAIGPDPFQLYFKDKTPKKEFQNTSISF